MPTQKPKPETADHPILQPFRLYGRWYTPEDKTVSLLPRQTQFLLQNGKIGSAKTPAKATKTREETK